MADRDIPLRYQVFNVRWLRLNRWYIDTAYWIISDGNQWRFYILDW